MKRKIGLLIFIFFISFLCMYSVSADTKQYTCTYRNKDDNSDKYELTYTISGNKINITNCDHNGTSCTGNAYRYDFDDVEVGTHTCPSSIDVTEGAGVTTITWIGHHNGKYVYSPQWECLYEAIFYENPDDLSYANMRWKYFSFYLEYWDKKFVIRKVVEYSLTCDTEKSDFPCTNFRYKNLFSELKYHLKNSDDIHLIAKQADESYYFSVNGNTVDYRFDISAEKYTSEAEKCPVIGIIMDDEKKISKVTFSEGLNSTALLSYTQNRVSTETIGEVDSCLTFNNEFDCEHADGIACLWVENDDVPGDQGGYCNVDKLTYVACGDATDIPSQAPMIISLAVNLLKIATPIILIFVSVISLVKALASSKEDEIKKAQGSLAKKAIASAMAFFVISIVQFVIMKVADSAEIGNISSCLSCFLNNDCGNTSYYKTVLAGSSEATCTIIGTGETLDCNNIAKVNYVHTDYYEGERAYSCNGEYWNGHQPVSVVDEEDGECYVVQKSGKYINFKTIPLSGETSWTTQKIWTANNKCYYWNGSINKYVNINCDTEVINDYYEGPRQIAKSDSDYDEDDYLSNKYQPRYSTEGEELKDSGNVIYVTKVKTSGTVVKDDEQTLWKDSKYYYYWSAMNNQYIKVSGGAKKIDDRNKKNQLLCDSKGYKGNKYQPNAINVNDACINLEVHVDGGIEVNATTFDGTEKRKQNVWIADGICYYWSDRTNEYKQISCDATYVDDTK